MKILILHDELPPDARPDEMDALVQADCVSRALLELGHTSETLACTLDLRELTERIRRIAPDCVFNLVESLAGQGRLVHVIPSFLDSLGMPYTGAGAEAMFLTSSKTLCKQFLAAHRIPTARWFTPELLSAGEAFLPGRYIIKSVWEEASVGIEDDSVRDFETPGELRAEMDRRRDRLGGSAFAEQYIDGREFNLSVLTGGDVGRVLPPAEIQFVGFAPDKPRIVGYSAKWREETHEFRNTPRTFDFPDTDRPLLDELMTLAEQCWQTLGLRGYARVDFRVDGNGRPFVLEINANPCLSPDAGFAAATARAGLSFPQVIERILRDAIGW